VQSILTDYVKGNLPRAILVGTISMACFHESASSSAAVDTVHDAQLRLQYEVSPWGIHGLAVLTTQLRRSSSSTTPGGSGNGILTGGHCAVPRPACDVTVTRLGAGSNLVSTGASMWSR